MIIDLNGPTRLLFDISDLINTLDRDGVLSPLAWQHVVERDIAVLGQVAVVSSMPHCPSLKPQYHIIRALQVREGIDVTNTLGPEIMAHLRSFIISIEMTSTTLIISKRKTLARSST